MNISSMSWSSEQLAKITPLNIERTAIANLSQSNYASNPQIDRDSCLSSSKSLLTMEWISKKTRLERDFTTTFRTKPRYFIPFDIGHKMCENIHG